MKQKIKKFILTALPVMLCLPVAVTAAGAALAATDDVVCLVVEETSGDSTTIALDEAPVITFVDDSLTVTAGDVALKIALLEMSGYHFGTVTQQIETAVTNPSAMAKTTAKPAYSGGTATFSGMNAGERVTVTTIGGRIVTTVSANSDGVARVDIRSLPKGVYILRSSKQNIKVTKH